MPLQSNSDVGTGGDGLGASALAGSGGFGLAIHASSLPGTGGSGICGQAPDGGGGNFFTIGEPAIVCLGASVEILIDVVPDADFTSGNIAMAASGLPSGVTASFSPNPVVITGGAATATTLTLTVSEIATTGDYTITVTGTSGGTEVELEIEITLENCEIEALRFLVDEIQWPPSTDIFQFRIQEMGSSDCYRLQSEGGPEGCDVVDTMGFRFSPDGRWLAAWYELTFGSDAKHLIRAYNLGDTLPNGGLWGDFDGEPQPNVYILDLEATHQVLSENMAIDDVIYQDISIDNDGSIWVLKRTQVPDEIQEEMIWGLVLFTGTPFDLGFEGGAGFIQVVADPRATDKTSTATFSVTQCGCANAPLTVDATPGVAWWSGSPDPVTGTCTTVTPSTFCRHSFLQVPQDIVCTSTERSTTSEMTITVDQTALGAGTYTDTGIFDFGDNANNELCGFLSTPNGDFQGLVGEGRLGEFRLKVAIPTLTELSLHKKTVAGVLEEQVATTFAANVWGSIDASSTVRPYGIPRILNVESRLVILPYLDQGSDHLMAIVDLNNGEIVYSEWPLGVFDADGDMMCQTQVGARNIYQWPGNDFLNLPQTFYSVITEERNGIIQNRYFDNTRADLHPELHDFFGGGENEPNASMFIIMTGDDTGYCLGGGFYDGTVRRIVAGSDEFHLEAVALPSDVTVSPGETDPTRVRGIEPYDGFHAEIGRRPNVQAVGVLSS